MDKRKRRPSFPQTCPQCGKEFKVWPSKPRRYCSVRCKARGQQVAKVDCKYKKGYRVLYVGHDHPMADGDGNCYEHRLVMADKLGRALERNEHVHHLNEDRLDNRPENLELMDPGDHHRLHKTLDRWATSYDACVACKGADSPHAAKGLCRLCYSKRWHAEQKL